jgi:hypothetical protein
MVKKNSPGYSAKAMNESREEQIFTRQRNKTTKMARSEYAGILYVWNTTCGL